ncbi:uncharacterized protein LOC121700183 isoform X3 [Alosa sapidissima]|uniref:uncharacterized protein LOC121700183 isoform X3 n=1 Tax=Alosa sapidissima TaxID=34773 RepID=UPI001C0A5816|nr:uncharacterized protein LOC121700183 isoform X3 [Alosa sapidissima]
MDSFLALCDHPHSQNRAGMWLFRVGWHQRFTLLCSLFVWILAASFISSVKAITVFEGANVLFPVNTTIDLDSIIQWSFSLHQNTRLLAMLANSGGIHILDSRFQITGNGSLVLEGARSQDAGDYICSIILSNGTVQKNTVNLQFQPHNITQSPDAKEEGNSFWTVIITITCSVAAAVVFLVGISSGIIYRCRKTDEAIYVNTAYVKDKRSTRPQPHLLQEPSRVAAGLKILD